MQVIEFSNNIVPIKYYKVITKQLTFYYSQYVIEQIMESILKYYETNYLSPFEFLSLADCCYNHIENKIIKSRTLIPNNKNIEDGTLDIFYNIIEKNIKTFKNLNVSDIIIFVKKK